MTRILAAVGAAVVKDIEWAASATVAPNDWQWLKSTSVELLLNLVYAIVALFVGVLALRLLDWIVLRKIDLEEEIKKGNIAAAILAGTLLLFIAIILGSTLAG